MDQVIGHGAEAVIYREKDSVVKDRISKSYRHPEIDFKLRKFRTRREAKVQIAGNAGERIDNAIEKLTAVKTRLQQVEVKNAVEISAIKSAIREKIQNKIASNIQTKDQLQQRKE